LAKVRPEPPAAAAHFNPKACAESAVRIKSFVPIGILSSALENPNKSPLVVKGLAPLLRIYISFVC